MALLPVHVLSVPILCCLAVVVGYSVVSLVIVLVLNYKDDFSFCTSINVVIFVVFVFPFMVVVSLLVAVFVVAFAVIVVTFVVVVLHFILVDVAFVVGFIVFIVFFLMMEF